MKKMIVFVISVILLMVVILLLINNSQTSLFSKALSNTCPSDRVLDKDYDFAICDRADPEDDVIIQRLVEKWLQKNTQEHVSDNLRLIDYKVESFDIMYDLVTPDGTYVFSLGAHVTYSVLPYLDVPHTNWIAPDGMLDENGWIIDKKMYIGVINHNYGIYELKLMGQCISC